MSRCVTEHSVIIVQVFDQRRFKEPSQGFLGVVNILVNTVISLNSIGTNTLKFDLRPSNSREAVKGCIMLSFTTDMSGSSGIPSMGPSAAVPLSLGRPISSGSQVGVAMGTASSSVRSSPGELQSVVQNKLVNSQQIVFDELGPLPPGYVTSLGPCRLLMDCLAW